MEYNSRMRIGYTILQIKIQISITSPHSAIFILLHSISFMASNRCLRILAFGASLTEGYYSGGLQFHPYTIQLAKRFQSDNQQVQIDNAGVSGEAVLSSTMLPRLKHLLATNPKYDWVLILAGTNDTLRDQQIALKVLEGYELLVNECQQYGANVLCMTLPEADVPLNSPHDKQRQEFNRLIRENLKTKNGNKCIFVVLDVDRYLPQHSLSPKEKRIIWDDEIHLTPKGYDRLGDMIYEKLRNYLQ